MKKKALKKVKLTARELLVKKLEKSVKKFDKESTQTMVRLLELSVDINNIIKQIKS